MYTPIILQLKLYAMHQKVHAPIDDTYSSNSHSADTIKKWSKDHIHVGNTAVSAQVLLPLFVTIYISLFFVYTIELEPYMLGKKVQNELESKNDNVKANADAKLLTKFTISFLFHAYTLAVDIAAMIFQFERLPTHIKEYYSSKPQRFWSIAIAMLVFDLVAFVCFIIIPFGFASYKKRWYVLTYCLISPLSCIASHSYHIVFAFIIDPYHATSILLLYTIILFVHVQGFQKLFYYMNYKVLKRTKCGQHGIYYLTIICYFIEFALMAVSIYLSVSLIMELPISTAIDDAPNHLYVIYQTSITFFAALIAFQVLFRQTNSAFDVFIKAEDANIKEAKKKEMEDIKLSDVARDNAKDWMDLSEKEKEIYLANLVISFLKSGAELANALKVQQFKESTPIEGAGEAESGGPGVENQPRVDITAEVCDIDIDQHPLILQTTTSN